jgi:hypothetical protein
MNTKKRRTLTYVAVALVVVVVALAGEFAYYYSTTTNQMSSLREAGLAECQLVASVANKLTGFVDNLSEIYQSQIQNDKSLIQTINSTKPVGYTGMLTTLENQIHLDFEIQNNISSIQGLSISTVSPCATFNHP